MGNYNCKECVERDKICINELCLGKEENGDDTLKTEKSKSSENYIPSIKQINSNPPLNNYPQYAIRKENLYQNINFEPQINNNQKIIKKLDDYDFVNKVETQNNEKIIQQNNDINSQFINSDITPLSSKIQKNNLKDYKQSINTRNNENGETNNEENDEENNYENENNEESNYEEKNFLENNYVESIGQNIDPHNINLRANIRPELGMKLFAEDKVENNEININKNIDNQSNEPSDSKRKKNVLNLQKNNNVVSVEKNFIFDSDQINQMSLKSNEPRDSKRKHNKISNDDIAFGLPYVKNAYQENNIYYETNIQNNNIINNNLEQKKPYLAENNPNKNLYQDNYNLRNSPNNNYQISQINQNNINNNIHYKNYAINQNFDQNNVYIQQNQQNYNQVDSHNLIGKVSKNIEIQNSAINEKFNSNLNDNKNVTTDKERKAYTLGPVINDVNNSDAPFSMRPKDVNYNFEQKPFTNAQEISMSESNNLYQSNESVTKQFNTGNSEIYEGNNSDKESDYYYFKKNEDLNK